MIKTFQYKGKGRETRVKMARVYLQEKFFLRAVFRYFPTSDGQQSLSSTNTMPHLRGMFT